MQGKNYGRFIRRCNTAVISIILSCSLVMSPVGARILQQSSALVDDGSQDSVPPSDSSSKAPAPAVTALDTSPSPSPTVVRARWASSVTQADDTGTNSASPPQSARLSWANQVRALPPAYQAIGAQIVSQALGPSADLPAPDDTTTAAAAPETAPTAPPPDAAARAPETSADPPLTVIGDPVPPVATFAPTPVPTLAPGAAVPAATFAPTPTPQPTFAPTRTPAAAGIPVATALPALMPIQAPAPGQVPEENSGADTLIVGTALAPQLALPPQPAASSMQCSDNGSGDSVALNICKFITVILPEATRQQMCGRYLPRCPPADSPAPASGMTAAATAAGAVPPAAPPAAEPPAATVETPAPAGTTAGGPPSIMGMPIPPIGDFLGSLARGLIGGASPTAALTPQSSPPAVAMAG
ncbi:hypothetical protein COCOBI_11-0600 [Coccomyxa sp. Obi]|nr:hypothetical protein COCOBI_11-0600 [Coccomyxa sp. Obi]